RVPWHVEREQPREIDHPTGLAVGAGAGTPMKTDSWREPLVKARFIRIAVCTDLPKLFHRWQAPVPVPRMFKRVAEGRGLLPGHRLQRRIAHPLQAKLILNQR